MSSRGMGCRTSCNISKEFSTAIGWISHNKLAISHAYVVHTFDDFIQIENSKYLALDKFMLLLDMCVEGRKISTAEPSY